MSGILKQNRVEDRIVLIVNMLPEERRHVNGLQY